MELQISKKEEEFLNWFSGLISGGVILIIIIFAFDVGKGIITTISVFLLLSLMVGNVFGLLIESTVSDVFNSRLLNNFIIKTEDYIKSIISGERKHEKVTTQEGSPEIVDVLNKIEEKEENELKKSIEHIENKPEEKIQVEEDTLYQLMYNSNSNSKSYHLRRNSDNGNLLCGRKSDNLVVKESVLKSDIQNSKLKVCKNCIKKVYIQQ